MATGRTSMKLLGLLSILSLGTYIAADGTCVETGAAGLCSVDGCCDNLVECKDDGSCAVPEPVCTEDSCDSGEVCAGGATCLDEDDVTFLINLEDDPLLGVISIGDSEVSVYAPNGEYISYATIFDEELDELVTVHFGDGHAQYAEVMTDDGLLTIFLDYNVNGSLVAYDYSVGGDRRALEEASGRRLTDACFEACEIARNTSRDEAEALCDQAVEYCLERAGNETNALVSSIVEALCHAMTRSLCDTTTAVSVISSYRSCIASCQCPTPSPTPVPTEACSVTRGPCNNAVDVCCEAYECVPNTDYPSDGPEYCCVPEGQNITSAAHGDPHLVGFRGQKFDFTGQDGGYYALLEDDSETLLNMKIHAPVSSVSQITYIVGFSLKANDLNGHPHTVEVYVNHPEDFYTPTKCPGGIEDPCLADGAITVLLDGKPMVSPGVEQVAPGISVGAVNLPGQCRPFGFENYWAKKVREAELAASATGRRLEMSDIPMNDWILGDSAATNMAECETYVAHAMEQGSLFDYQSEHVSFQIVTPRVIIRANHGKLHQIAMRDPTDTFDLPDHRTFQQNIAIEKAVLGTHPQGVLGETTRPTVDDAGEPIMFGMAAVRGGEEDYRVSGPFMTDFALRMD